MPPSHGVSSSRTTEAPMRAAWMAAAVPPHPPPAIRIWEPIDFMNLDCIGRSSWFNRDSHVHCQRDTGLPHPTRVPSRKEVVGVLISVWMRSDL